MADLTEAVRRYLSVFACVAALAVVGGLFVPDPTSPVLALFFVVVLGVGGHALSADAPTELAYATLACVGAALVVVAILGVGATLFGDRWGVEVSAVVLGAALPVALLTGYVAARRRVGESSSV